MADLNDEEIAELREFDRAATPAHSWGAFGFPCIGGSEFFTFHARGPTGLDWIPATYENGRILRDARCALPRLLDEVERFRACGAKEDPMADLTDEEIAELRAYLSDVCGECGGIGIHDSGCGLAAKLRAALPRLLDEVEHRRERDARTLALLQRVEFGGERFGETVCLECGAIEPPHKPDCALAKLIAELTPL